MSTKSDIRRVSIPTAGGNSLDVFYNPEKNLLVIDLTQKNGKGGNEIIRMTLKVNEKSMLRHCEKETVLDVDNVRESALYKGMTAFRACEIAEGFGSGEEATYEQKCAAWQYLIDTRLAWTLQGFYGRTAKMLIDTEQCLPPVNIQSAKSINL
jgi:hypothetical protein